jgi:hypothetical protein
MTQYSPDDNSSVIRITAEEANSSHVDDLLKRHASLRGERGITRDRSRRFYYQNWFVFMIAGALFAFAGWVIMEPFFDDMLYIQGKVHDIRDEPFTPLKQADYVQNVEFVQGSQRHILAARIGSYEVLLMPGQTKWIERDGKYTVFQDGQLRINDNVGMYAEPIASEQGELAVVEFLVANPKPPANGEAPTLSHLAARKNAAGLLLFPVVAAMIGLGLGAADGLMCRLFRRMLLGGFIGLIVGFLGGFLATFLAELVYGSLHHLAMRQEGGGFGHLTTFGFVVQVIARALGWCLAGMAMGLGQGIALRSKRLFLYGFLGGLLGGILGGLLFDPIDLMILGWDKPSAHIARLVGITIIGGTVGMMIGIVELLARDAWLRMVEGPLVGKEFLVFKDLMRMGASPRSEIYLFNDEQVAPEHAQLRATGDTYELENSCRENPVLVNGRPVHRCRLRHGDRITLGRTSFIFQRQRAD